MCVAHVDVCDVRGRCRSGNHLSGPIPAQALARLFGLSHLNLGSNHLTGKEVEAAATLGATAGEPQGNRRATVGQP